MLGFFSAGAGDAIFSCATAGAAIPTGAKPIVRATAKAVIAHARRGLVLLLRFSAEGMRVRMEYLLSKRHPSHLILSLRTVTIKHNQADRRPVSRDLW